MAKKDNTSKILGIVAIAAGGYFLYEKFIKKDDPLLNTQAPLTTGTQPTGSPSISSYYPIVYNKYNPDVKALQALLNVSQDGIIGPKTLAMIQMFNPGFTTSFRIDNPTQLQNLINMVKGTSGTINTSGGLTTTSLAQNGDYWGDDYGTDGNELSGIY
jgi:hypothetical protein